MVTLSGDVVHRYERFSSYNSPYPAHDHGHAVDLYPGHDDARSPVAGEVLDTRTVRCPPKDYAVDQDHLVLIDTGEHVARILHVDPAVEAGDRVDVGDSLGTLVRSGFFGQWVDNHVHLEFRDPDRDPYRATGSLPLDLDVDVAPVPWDGAGTVVETGPTHALLDAPAHPGDGFAAVAADEGVPLDGGLVHYSGAGTLAAGGHEGPVSLLGCRVGVADGRDVTWNDVAVLADVEPETSARPRADDPAQRGDGDTTERRGRDAVERRGGDASERGVGEAIDTGDDAPETRRVRATGLSLFASKVEFGAKLVFHEGHDLAVGDRVSVDVRETDDPIHLG